MLKLATGLTWRSEIALQISALWLLGRLWEVRNCRIEANPSLRVSGVDVEHGFEAGSIVQRGKNADCNKGPEPTRSSRCLSGDELTGHHQIQLLKSTLLEVGLGSLLSGSEGDLRRWQAE